MWVEATLSVLENSHIFLVPCMPSVQFSRSVVSNSLPPHGLQHTRLPCPSPTPGAYSNSCPSSQWCHPTISSSVVPFSSCLQSFPASGSFAMSQFCMSLYALVSSKMGLLRRRVKPYKPGFLLLVNYAQHKAVKENPQSLAGMRPWRLTGVHGVGLGRCKCSPWAGGPRLWGDWTFQGKPQAWHSLAPGAGGCVSWERYEWCLSQDELSGPRRQRKTACVVLLREGWAGCRELVFSVQLWVQLGRGTRCPTVLLMAQREAGQRQEGPLDGLQHVRGTVERRANPFCGFEDQDGGPYLCWFVTTGWTPSHVRGLSGMCLHFF